MRILIDIGHPAHVHMFKNFAWKMLKKEHEILFTVRDKENEVYLLNSYGFTYKSYGKHYQTKAGKILGLLHFNIKMLSIALSFKPDILLSHGSIYAAQVAWLIRKPHISLEDTGNMEQIILYRPFTKAIITPVTLRKNLGPKQIRVNTYHELAYLKPAYFKKSDDILKQLNVLPGENFCLIRLVSWNATHDAGKNGLNEKELNEIVDYLSIKMKVFISSEKKLSPNLLKYRLSLSPDTIHNVVANSSLVISEGATLAAEAGFLGVPTIYVNPQQTCNNYELEEIGCVKNFKNGHGVLENVVSILDNSSGRNIIDVNLANLINQKVDLTLFMVWFIENYPNSFKIIKANPSFQERFK